MYKYIFDFVHCTAYVNVHTVGGGCVLYQSQAYAIYVYVHIYTRTQQESQTFVHISEITSKLRPLDRCHIRHMPMQKHTHTCRNTHTHAETHTHMQKHTQLFQLARYLSLICPTVYCNTLQHTAKHRNTPHHTATHSNNTHTHSCIHLLAIFLCLSLHACM